MLTLVAAVALAAEPEPLRWNQLRELSGVTATSTKEQVVAAWGKPLRETRASLEFPDGRTFTREPKGVVSVQLTKPATGTGSPLWELVGEPCEAATARLAFADADKSSQRCKHFDAVAGDMELLLVCRQQTIAHVSLKWFPRRPTMRDPPDHCVAAQ